MYTEKNIFAHIINAFTINIYAWPLRMNDESTDVLINSMLYFVSLLLLYLWFDMWTKCDKCTLDFIVINVIIE